MTNWLARAADVEVAPGIGFRTVSVPLGGAEVVIVRLGWRHEGLYGSASALVFVMKAPAIAIALAVSWLFAGEAEAGDQETARRFASDLQRIERQVVAAYRAADAGTLDALRRSLFPFQGRGLETQPDHTECASAAGFLVFIIDDMLYPPEKGAPLYGRDVRTFSSMMSMCERRLGITGHRAFPPLIP
ncbi:hypothetical protein [Prosthecodimorpha staleyi]|uniref:Uncharacterized protein n=1 Tax=Prosthecodimorpha staleyi TaxID=2840188 RepID=A0A947GEE2_9HYPH|nr:hypothetical protein [Prosthecodimorpha staleyi]MBT9291321.1 hypothetical protein [Prosthecodimorpha staleyi]